MKWFSVEDRLPCTDEDVLITDGTEVIVAYNDSYSDWNASNVSSSYDMASVQIDLCKITHWRDMVELPPKEVK